MRAGLYCVASSATWLALYGGHSHARSKMEELRNLEEMEATREAVAQVKAQLDAAFDTGAANEELRRTDPEAYKAKMEAQLPTNTCCFCREMFRGYGNNPAPVLEEGTARDACNHSIVIAARFQAMRR